MNILIIADFYIYGGGTFSVLEKIIRMHNDMGHKTELLIEKNKTTTQLNFLCKTYKVNITTYPVRKLIFENPLFSIIYELFIYLFYIRNISYDLIFVTNGVCYYFMTLLFFKNPIVLLMNAYPKQGFSLKYKFMYLF